MTANRWLISRTQSGTAASHFQAVSERAVALKIGWLSEQENDMAATLSFLREDPRFALSREGVSQRQKELFAAAKSEAENVGVLSAVVACTLNDISRSGGSMLPNFISRFIPSDPILLQNFGRLAGGSDTTDLESHLDTFSAQMRIAKTLLRESLEDARSFLTHHEVDQISHAWRGVCDYVLVVLADLDALLPGSPAGGEHIDRLMLENSLLDARNGGSELSLKRGLSFPKWAQRRQHRRVLLNDIGKAKINGRTRAVLITDASVGGLGLDFTEGAKKGERIAVMLSSGRTFVGKVAWTAGTRSGMQFDEELALNDILFSWESF